MKSYICLTNSKNMLRSLVCRPLKYALEICLQFNMRMRKIGKVMWLNLLMGRYDVKFLM